MRRTMYHHLQPNIKYEVIYLKKIMSLLHKLLQCGYTHAAAQWPFVRDYLHPPCSIYMLESPFPQPLSRSFLIFLLVLDPLLHTSYISSPNRHLYFVTHAHTITAGLAVIPVLRH